jgi:hypothetical protein
MLAAGTNLRMADMGGRMATILPELIREARRRPTPDSPIDPTLLASDRLLQAWWRLCEEGRLAHAAQARDAFLELGKNHPLFRSMNVMTLAMLCSEEYMTQFRRVTPDPSLPVEALARAAKKFPRWHPWSDSAEGLFLQARGLLATSPQIEAPRARRRATELLTEIVNGPYPKVWQSCAEVERNLLTGQRPRRGTRVVARAPFVEEPGQLDGLFEEKFWSGIKRRTLRETGSPRGRRGPKATVQIFRTVGNLVLGFRLPAQVGRVWKVVVGIDSDRDAWTQLLLEFDSAGRKDAFFACRLGPRMKLDKRIFLIQAPRRPEGRVHTFEVAIPLQQVGDPFKPGLWNFQIRATADDGTRVRHLYFQPQSDNRMLPVRYGLLEYGPAEQE